MDPMHFFQLARIGPFWCKKKSADEAGMRQEKPAPVAVFFFIINGLYRLQTVARHCFDFRIH
jgi:hypothetical protein